MRMKLFLAFGVVFAGFAGHADAQTCVGTADAGIECPETAGATTALGREITSNTTWSNTVNNPAARIFRCPIVLNQPIFVKGGATLTIDAGCVVRGQPRQAAVAAGVVDGTPGALIITQTGKINAVGSPGSLLSDSDDSPIIFTTAAVDNNGDNVPDNLDANVGFIDPSTNPATDVYLDDTPLTAPLAPLRAGDLGQNVALWGGVVILGNAPTNLSNLQGVGYGQATIEGLAVPGYPSVDVKYGGVDPHDSSGRMAYFSIRHGGDEIGNSNELNCMSLGGVGDGTDISFGECYANFDDGFEFFGGTVNTNNLVTSAIGDDSFDVDEGYTGVSQFWFAIQATFRRPNPSNPVVAAEFGSASGDKGCECDGDNYNGAAQDIDTNDDGVQDLTPNVVNLNGRFQQPGAVSPVADVENTPWPLSNPAIYNMTVIGPYGSVTDGFVNPASFPTTGTKRGFDMRNGFAGKVFNTAVVNFGTSPGLDVRNGDFSVPGFDAEANAASGRIAVVTSAFDDVAAQGGPETPALANGDAHPAGLGAPNNPSSLNCVNTGWAGLLSENTYLNPNGNAAGKLDATVIAAPIDPEPVTAGASANCATAGVPPRLPGLDATATYRGAFRNQTTFKWTTGWTLLNRSGVLAD